MKNIHVTGFIVLLAAGLAMPTRATIIPFGLYDTGVDASGNSLTGGSIDPHYILDGGGAVVVANAYPVGAPAWLDYSAPNGVSRWISGDSSGGNDGPTTIHTYTTTFTLSGLANVTLSGLWASDNAAAVYLNGVLIGTIPFGTPNNYSFQQYSGFSTSVQSDFLAGVNTLTFLVQNGDNSEPGGLPAGPFGVRVESLDITGVAVPEPATVIAGLLLVIPLCASGFRIIRNRNLMTV